MTRALWVPQALEDLRSIRTEVIVKSYRIVYQLKADDAFILTVFHGARSFPTRE